MVVVRKAKASDDEVRSTGASVTNRRWRQRTTDVDRLMRTFSSYGEEWDSARVDQIRCRHRQIFHLTAALFAPSKLPSGW